MLLFLFENVSDVRFSGVFIFVLTLFIYTSRTQGQEFMCCSHVTGTCKNACEKISLVEIASNAALRKDAFNSVVGVCSSQIKPFWDCLNATFEEISLGENWSGRVCCPFPLSETCKRTCVTATSLEELTYNQGCRQSDELAFFGCLERQSIGDSCCSQATTIECKIACSDIFSSHHTPTKQQRDSVTQSCQYNSPKVLNCVSNYTKVTPATNLLKHLQPCCDRSNKSKCREACRNVLTETDCSFEEIVDKLETKGCGPPLLQDHFWQCFVQPESDVIISTVPSSKLSRIDRVGMDSSKWHCCQKAASSQCRKLCSRTYTKDWSTVWTEFNSKCLSQKDEHKLKSCIDDVDEPCQLGCDGLSFCTNFNNRPTELFRSCNSDGDLAAKREFTRWQNHSSLTLLGISLPLKDISKCSPDTWKTIACILQMKPCSRMDPGDSILCRDICLQVLSNCIDWNRFPTHYTAESICEKLSSSNKDKLCTPFQKYMYPSENNNQRGHGQVSFPCKGNPCKTCLVNRNYDCPKDAGGFCQQIQPSYSCVPGCTLGEVSEYSVPSGSYVRIPIPNTAKGRLKVCRCSETGGFEECQQLPLIQWNSCLTIDGKQKEHGSKFNEDCKTCICFAGEVICNNKQCDGTSNESNDPMGNFVNTHSTLPCNCPPHYVPVCGRNGVTYPSSCLAKCAGLSDGDIEFEACKDPCRSHPCSFGQKCIPNPQTCLSLNHKPCLQYQCVNGTTNCRNLPHEPVCDIDGKQFENPCHLAHNSGKLAYRGPCSKKCLSKGEICGINGRTYSSECAAWSDFISVDYRGPCRAVGLITENNSGPSNKCDGFMKCPSLPDPDCIGVTPTGACCPLCAGAFKILYSKVQIDNVLDIFIERNIPTYSLTLQTTLKALERQVQVAQCALRGYLTVEQDIFILLQTTERYPSELQLEACVREAERIADMINRQSSIILGELSLSYLLSADVVHSQIIQSSGDVTGPCRNLVLILIAIIIKFSSS